MNHIELKKLAEMNPTANALFHFAGKRKRAARGSTSTAEALSQYMARLGYEVSRDSLRGVLNALGACGVGVWDGTKFTWSVPLQSLKQYALDRRTEPRPQPKPMHITIERPGLKVVVDGNSPQALEIIKGILGAA
jgi:hypothetical protein